jgi:hypothetical protein
MILDMSARSTLSLCQFLSLFERSGLALLLEKHGLQAENLRTHHSEPKETAIRDAIIEATPSSLSELVHDITRTRRTMRSGVNPKYTFDERWLDLERCLQIDGYALAHDEYGHELDEFAPIEPIIGGAHRAEDELTVELKRSGLASADDILRLLEDSATAFRGGQFNACLTNARVALQTLAKEIAVARRSHHPGSFDETKWGQVIAYLRTSGFIMQQQEEGLAGVFTFLSPGAHVPIGFTDEEFARLGRSLSVSFCYFLAKTPNAP